MTRSPPLVSQLALLDQLRRDNQSVAPETLNQIDRLARRSYQLAEEFVQLARAEELTDKRFYDCELLTIAENAVDAVQEQALANQVRLELDGREDLWLSGNAELLERAVINLLTNAIQYSPSNTVVAVSVENAGQTGALSVTDQGPGIELEDQPMIFQRFRRQKGTEMGGASRSGLGLAFVQTVAGATPGRGGSGQHPGSWFDLPALSATDRVGLIRSSCWPDPRRDSRCHQYRGSGR